MFKSCLILIVIICHNFSYCHPPPVEPFNSHKDYRSSKNVYHRVKSKPNKVILMLADGVRYDYVKDPNLKAFNLLAKKGVKAQYVQPIFPSNSYPNWYSIVTGLYAESHGMVQNYMHDEKLNDTFLMYPHENATHEHWWNDAEPLWVTAEKQGIKTAVFWWDGCQLTIRNTTATMCQEYQSFWSWPTVKEDTINAIDEILDNFESDDWGLALIYYEGVDSYGHAWGPDSQERLEAMKDLDDILVKIDTEIDRRNMSDSVNLVLVSDHGMLNVNTDKPNGDTIAIDLEKHIDKDDVDVMLDRGGTSMVIPVKGRGEKIIDDLKRAKVKGLNYYLKQDIPSKYHFKNSAKVSPILLVADKGYFVRGIPDKTKPVSEVVYPGHHGYDPYDVKEMRTIMYATGPGLKKDFLSKPLMMTDHYNLLCHLLNINAMPNNGSWLRVMDMLSESHSLIELTDSESNNAPILTNQSPLIHIILTIMFIYHY